MYKLLYSPFVFDMNPQSQSYDFEERICTQTDNSRRRLHTYLEQSLSCGKPQKLVGLFVLFIDKNQKFVVAGSSFLLFIP